MLLARRLFRGSPLRTRISRDGTTPAKGKQRKAAPPLLLMNDSPDHPGGSSAPSIARAGGKPPGDGGGAKSGKRGSVRALTALNFCIADVQNGMGPYVALFLQSAVGWGPAQIGTALAAGNLAQVITQTPAGALIDRLRQKRALLVVGIVFIAAACLATVWFTSLPVVTAAQALIGVAGAVFPPCLAAVALGLVGRARMDRQMGTNQAFNAGGNMFAALALGATGYYFGMKWMFYLVGWLCIAAVTCVSFIRADDIDYDLARGADCEPDQKKAQQTQGGVFQEIEDLLKGFAELFKQRTMLVFMASAVIFHFANAAMVPLVTQMLAKNAGAQTAILYTSGYMVASQLVFLIVAAISGRLASRIGRKPLFLFAFAALAVRGVLYTLSNKPAALIAVQCIDGWRRHFRGRQRAHRRGPDQGHGPLQRRAGGHRHGAGLRSLPEQLRGRRGGQARGQRLHLLHAGRHRRGRSRFLLAAHAGDQEGQRCVRHRRGGHSGRTCRHMI